MNTLEWVHRGAEHRTLSSDSYTSTVGQYRTYPLGFTHNGSCGSRSPPYQSHRGRTRAPRHNVSLYGFWVRVGGWLTAAALDAPCRLERGPGSGFSFYRPLTLVLNSAYTGPYLAIPLGSSGAVLRSRSAVRASMFGGVNLLSSSAHFAGPLSPPESGTHGRWRAQEITVWCFKRLL